MREDAEKLTKNIHEQLEHTCLKDITVVIHIIAATKSMGAKELLIEMVHMRHFFFKVKFEIEERKSRPSLLLRTHLVYSLCAHR
jgi:hypothetical protein